MPTELDRKYDSELATVTGPEGRIQIGRDDQGRAIVTNLPATLPGLFDAFCMLHGATESVVADGERLTFAALSDAATRAARALAGGWGVGKGDRVAIAMRNAPTWIILYMAVLKAGGIATLVNGWWQADELAHGLSLTSPCLVLCDAPRAARLEATGLDIPSLTLPVEKGLDEALAPLLARGGAEAELPEILPEDDATILFTSGSTGLSKGALSTHRAVTTGVYAYTISLLALLGILENEGRPPANPPKTLVNVPLFHVTGEVPVLLNSFVIGRTMVLMAKWDPGEALRLIEREKITYFVGVPTMSLEMMQHPDRDKYDLSSLTDIAAGGAARPVAHVKRLQQSFRGAQPALGYGLTETNAVGCHNFWDNYAAKPGSTGRAHKPFVEVSILGESDRHLPAGEVGEIGIRTAASIKGYWEQPEATATLFTGDGYVRTGDVGYLDNDGYLFIVDRKKDIIIRGGENISAAEVEAACYTCPAVAEASVFGAPDERLGEIPVAVVHANRGLTADELRAFLEQRIAKFKIPERIIFSAEPLPRLGTGKIDRRSLKAQYAR
ncbi:MAG: class I adenylate-forming enzyme family protein [Allosphingosinicella sp.]